MDGYKKIAAMVTLVIVVLCLIPVAMRPLTYKDVDWVQLGQLVYYPDPDPVGLPPIYLPVTMRPR